MLIYCCAAFRAFAQIRSQIVDEKDNEIQDFEVHITNSLQLFVAKILFFLEISK